MGKSWEYSHLREHQPRWDTGQDTAERGHSLIREQGYERTRRVKCLVFISGRLPHSNTRGKTMETSLFTFSMLQIPRSLPVVASEHDEGVPSTNGSARYTWQHLICSTHSARKLHVHVGLILLKVVEGEVAKVVDRVVWGTDNKKLLNKDTFRWVTFVLQCAQQGFSVLFGEPWLLMDTGRNLRPAGSKQSGHSLIIGSLPCIEAEKYSMT